MPEAGWSKMSQKECALATRWHNEDNESITEIATRLQRDKSVISRLLAGKAPMKKQGRPCALTNAQVDFLIKRLHTLITKANKKYTVTCKMLKRSARSKASERTIRDALHKRNVYFRPMREKPVLTDAVPCLSVAVCYPRFCTIVGFSAHHTHRNNTQRKSHFIIHFLPLLEDIKERYAFAKKFRNKTAAWWAKNVQAFIDGKHFQVYLNGKDRDRAAQHATWGAYRSPGQGLSGGYVKPKKSLRHNTGHRSALIQAGVGNGKVFMWYCVPNGRWSGNAAAVMYKGPLAKALQKAWPGRRSFNVLEDNDPTGYKSNKGNDAKVEAKIKPFHIPRRSPDLSLCDYALWPAINRRMRAQEQKWRRNKRESREEYMSRLRRTATHLPKTFIAKAVADMKRRCQRLYEAKGNHFEEGGALK